MFKSVYFRLSLITAVTLLAFLIAIPRVPIVFKKWGINIDSSLGGYFVNLFNGKFVFDLTEYKKGLDIEGGIRIVLAADTSEIADAQKDAAITSAIEVLRRRVDLLGVNEPNITPIRVGEERRIVVEIPGISDINTAVKLIGQTAQLKFKVLAEGNEWSEDRFLEYYLDPTLWKDSGITGADLKGADVVFSQELGVNSGTPQIQLRFTNEGRQKFSDLAKENVGKPVGIFLDENSNPLSMPTIGSDLATGVIEDPVISGSFDIDTANNLSLQIRAGALPVPVKILEQKTVGATLGSESIHKSFFAGALGLLLVMLFMLYSYGRLGLLADIALVIYTLIVLAVFKLVPVVVTLPGIAGFILSIGVAADANILIFERIKEELRWGTPSNLAIKFGFDRAWNSIKDSNIASMISAAILFYFGTGSVRGFALTLVIGIAVSLFSSIFVVRTLVTLFGKGFKAEKNANY